MFLKKIILSLSLAGALYASSSDHTPFRLEGELGSIQTSVVQLNVAQSGKLQLFVNGEQPVWSSTLRTVHNLRTLAADATKEALGGFFDRIRVIATDDSRSIDVRNGAIQEAAIEFLISLGGLGFSVKSVEMTPSKFFNPGVKPADLKKNPDQYIKQPSFLLEDAASFQARMIENGRISFKDNPDFVTMQEVELQDGVESLALTAILSQGPGYAPVIPAGLSKEALSSSAVTFYDSQKYEPDAGNSSVLQLRNFF